MLLKSLMVQVFVIYFFFFIDKNCCESSTSKAETGKVIHLKIFSPKYKYSIKEIFPSSSSFIIDKNKQANVSHHSDVQVENVNQSKQNILASSNSYAQSIPNVLINLSYRSPFSPFFKLFEASNSTESDIPDSDSIQNINAKKESNSTSDNQKLSSFKKKMNSYLGSFKTFLFQRLGLNNSNHSYSFKSLTSESRSSSENSFLTAHKLIENNSRVNLDASASTNEENTFQEQTSSANQIVTSESMNNNMFSSNKIKNERNLTNMSLSFSENVEIANLTNVILNQNSSSSNGFQPFNNFTKTSELMVQTEQTEQNEYTNLSFLTTSTKMETFFSNKTLTNINPNTTAYATYSNKDTTELFSSNRIDRFNVSFKIKNSIELLRNSFRSQIKNSKLKSSYLKRPNAKSTKMSKILNNFNLTNENSKDLSNNSFDQTGPISVDIEVTSNKTENPYTNLGNVSKIAANESGNSQENINRFNLYETNFQTETNNFANSSIVSIQDKTENPYTNLENVSKLATNEIKNSQNINLFYVYETNTSTTTSSRIYSFNTTTVYETNFHTQTETNNFDNSSVTTIQDNTENPYTNLENVSKIATNESGDSQENTHRFNVYETDFQTETNKFGNSLIVTTQDRIENEDLLESIDQIDKNVSNNIKTFDLTKTVGGNSNGANCHFPFVYQNQIYNSCINREETGEDGSVSYVKICSTTSNLDKDKKWGYCLDYSLCHFPFYFNNTLYKSCISTHLSPSFCSTTLNFDQDRAWTNCPVVCAGFPEKDSKVISFSYQNSNQPCQLKQQYDKQNGLKIVDYVEPSCHIEYSCEPGYRRLYDEIKCELDGFFNRKAFCLPENFFRILKESHGF